MTANGVVYDGISCRSPLANEDDAPPLHAEETKDASFVHPDAVALFRKIPCLRYVPLFGQASEGYGPKTSLSLAMSYLLCKGISDYLIRNATLPFFTQYYGVDGPTYQRLDNVINMGWSLKAIIALISDMIAFFKYTKRWYMLVSCLVGAAMTIVMGLLPPKPSSAVIAAGLAFVSCFTKANVDILLEGHYSRLIRRLPGPGPALVSWIWWFILLGSLVSAVIIGPLADAGKVYVCAFLASVFQLVACVFFIFNWYGEKTNREERLEDARLLHEAKLRTELNGNQGGHQLVKSTHPEEFSDDEGARSLDLAMVGLDAETGTVEGAQEVVPFEHVEPVPCCCGVFEVNTGVLARNKRLAAYSVLMACGVLTMALLSMMGTSFQLLYGCITVSVILSGFNFYALPLIVAKANMFNYLQKASAVRFPGALNSFYTAAPDCVPDGPHFNFFFFTTVVTVISTIAGVAGITLFNYVLAKRSYRVAFISTTLFGILAAVFDLVIVMRWNRPHIDDHVMFILGDAIVQEVIVMMRWMPMILLISKLCPRGTESMVYAILAGFGNLGQAMSSTIGSLIMELAWTVQTKPPCDFSNLPKMIVFSGMLLPLLQIPLCFLLIPSARMCDDLDIEDACLCEEMAAKKKQQDCTK